MKTDRRSPSQSPARRVATRVALALLLTLPITRPEPSLAQSGEPAKQDKPDGGKAGDSKADQPKATGTEVTLAGRHKPKVGLETRLTMALDERNDSKVTVDGKVEQKQSVETHVRLNATVRVDRVREGTAMRRTATIERFSIKLNARTLEPFPKGTKLLIETEPGKPSRFSVKGKPIEDGVSRLLASAFRTGANGPTGDALKDAEVFQLAAPRRIGDSWSPNVQKLSEALQGQLGCPVPPRWLSAKTTLKATAEHFGARFGHVAFTIASTRVLPPVPRPFKAIEGEMSLRVEYWQPLGPALPSPGGASEFRLTIQATPEGKDRAADRPFLEILNQRSEKRSEVPIQPAPGGEGGESKDGK